MSPILNINIRSEHTFLGRILKAKQEISISDTYTTIKTRIDVDDDDNNNENMQNGMTQILRKLFIKHVQRINVNSIHDIEVARIAINIVITAVINLLLFQMKYFRVL